MKKQMENKFAEEGQELKPFIAPGSLEPVTQEEIDKRKRRVVRAEDIGQSIMRVTSEQNGDEEYENPYCVEAMRYILNDMDVPKELKEKMLEFDKRHEEAIEKCNSAHK